MRDVERLLPQMTDDAEDPQHATVVEQLKAVGPALPAALDLVATARKQPVPEAIYRDVLPAVSDEFRLIERLNCSDLKSQNKIAGDSASDQSLSDDQLMARLKALQGEWALGQDAQWEQDAPQRKGK